jgi:hypothetical protein
MVTVMEYHAALKGNPAQPRNYPRSCKSPAPAEIISEKLPPLFYPSPGKMGRLRKKWESQKTCHE